MTDYERTEIETRRADTHVPVEAESRRVTERYVERGPGPASVAGRVVVLLFGILQALLILRIILLLLIANPGNDIVAFILSATDPFVEPFRGMFALDRVTGDQGSQLDVAAIVALIGWTLIEALILAALRIFSRRPADTV